MPNSVGRKLHIFEAAGSFCVHVVVTLFLLILCSSPLVWVTTIHCNPKPLMHMVKKGNMIALRAGVDQYDL